MSGKAERRCSERSPHWAPARERALKVSCCRSVCLLYSVLCLASLPTPTKSDNPRCGTELMSDLLFVCGDRGFHIGKPAGFRSRYRLREHRIVDQCCLKGCSLNYMETYCAKPRSRRYVAPSPQQVTEQQFHTVFHRRLVKHLETAKGPHGQTHERVENNNPHERRHRSSKPAGRHREHPTTSSPTL
ncbi:insulin-like growth factor 3 [Osmerus eperlanus]|uniref:insulin-like growth factor 3 n=1 Tax=Osmerus eperlanus TaxID=29151 RepID=UPI002E14A514